MCTEDAPILRSSMLLFVEPFTCSHDLQLVITCVYSRNDATAVPYSTWRAGYEAKDAAIKFHRVVDSSKSRIDLVYAFKASGMVLLHLRGSGYQQLSNNVKRDQFRRRTAAMLQRVACFSSSQDTTVPIMCVKMLGGRWPSFMSCEGCCPSCCSLLSCFRVYTHCCKYARTSSPHADFMAIAQSGQLLDSDRCHGGCAGKTVPSPPHASTLTL